jgi:colicin import membrane protein
MSSAKPPAPRKDQGGQGSTNAGAPKLVRFFSVEGQRRRLEFAKLPPARAMTPEEEAQFMDQLEARERAAREKAAAEEKAARQKTAREKGAREKGAREKGARAKAAAAGRGGRAAGTAKDTAELSEPSSRAGQGARTSRGRHAAPVPEGPAVAAGYRAGGRRAVAGSEETSSAAPPAATPAPAPVDGGRGAGARKKVSRRGVIGAAQPREED